VARIALNLLAIRFAEVLMRITWTNHGLRRELSEIGAASRSRKRISVPVRPSPTSPATGIPFACWRGARAGVGRLWRGGSSEAAGIHAAAHSEGSFP